MPVSVMLNAVTSSSAWSSAALMRKPHLALLGELERVGEQVLEHLAQAP